MANPLKKKQLENLQQSTERKLYQEAPEIQQEQVVSPSDDESVIVLKDLFGPSVTQRFKLKTKSATGIVKRYGDLLQRIDLASKRNNIKPSVQTLINEVKDVLTDYLDHTLTPSNVDKQISAASKHRLKEIQEMVEACETLSNSAFAVHNGLEKIVVGMKDTRFGSKLHHQLKQILSKGPVLDPTQLSKEEAKVLKAFLLKQLSDDKDVIPAGGPYTVEIEEGGKKLKRIFSLKYSLIRREKIVYEDEDGSNVQKAPRYSVLGNEFIGSGSYGNVYNVLGTIKFTENALSFNNKHPRIDKSIGGLEIAKREAYVLKHIPHTRAKNLSIEEYFNEISHITMSAFGDMDLKKFFKTKLAQVSLAQRHQLAVNLLRALQEQVHDQGFRHGDIKPANIRIDSNTLEVFFVDFGKAIEEEHFEIFREMGTPLYMSTEEATNAHTAFDYKTDMYAMGLVLSELFGAEQRHRSNIKKQAKTRQVFKNLFDGIDAHQQDKDDIENMLHQMTNTKKSERPLPKEAIALFNKKYLAEKISGLADGEAATKAHQLGVELYDQLYPLSLLIRDVANSNAIKDQLKQTINELLATSHLNDEAIEIFVDTTKIKSFVGLKPEQMLEQVDAVTNKLDQQLDQLSLFTKQVAKLNRDYRKLLEAFSHLDGTRGEYAQHALKMLTDLKQAWFELKHKQTTRQNKLDDWDDLANIYAARLPTLIEKASSLKLWLASEHHHKLNNYKKIYSVLRTVTDQNDEAAELKNAIKSAIKKYLDDNLTPQNVRQANGAASGSRHKDILAVLAILDKEAPPLQLINELKQHLGTVHSTRFFESTFKKKMMKIVGRCEMLYKAEKPKASQQNIF